MQWRRTVEPDVIDSGDEAQRSGEDSELEGDGGLRCCQQASSNGKNNSNDAESTGGSSKSAEVGGGTGSGGGREEAGADTGRVGGEVVDVAARGGDVNAKLPWVAAMIPPSNVKVKASMHIIFRLSYYCVRHPILLCCASFNVHHSLIMHVVQLFFIDEYFAESFHGNPMEDPRKSHPNPEGGAWQHCNPA